MERNAAQQNTSATSSRKITKGIGWVDPEDKEWYSVSASMFALLQCNTAFCKAIVILKASHHCGPRCMFCLIHDIMHDTAFNSRKTISAITDFTNAIKGKYKLYKRVHQCLPQACFVAILQCIEHQITRNDIDILTSACFFRSIRTMTCDLCWTSNKQIDDTPLVASLVSSYTRFTDAIKNATINAVKSISDCKKSGVCTNCNERVKKDFSKHTVSTPDTFMFKPWFDSKSPDGSVCVYSQVSFQDIANEKARHEIQGLIVSKRMPGGKEEYQAYVRQSKGFARLPLPVCSDSDVQTSLASIELDDPVDLKLICWKKVPNIPSNSSLGDPTVSSVMSSASTLTTVSMRPGVSETQLTSDGGKSKDKPYQKISSVSSKWEQKGTSKGHSLSAKSASPAVPAPVAPSTLPSTAVTVVPSTAVTVAMTPSPWASRAVTVAPSTAVTVAVTPTTLPSTAVTVAMAQSPWTSRAVTVAPSPGASRAMTVAQSPWTSRAVTVAMAPSTVPSTTVTVAPSRAVTVEMTTSPWTSRAMTVTVSPSTLPSTLVTVTMAPSTLPSTGVTVSPSILATTFAPATVVSSTLQSPSVPIRVAPMMLPATGAVLSNLPVVVAQPTLPSAGIPVTLAMPTTVAVTPSTFQLTSQAVAVTSTSNQSVISSKVPLNSLPVMSAVKMESPTLAPSTSQAPGQQTTLLESPQTKMLKPGAFALSATANTPTIKQTARPFPVALHKSQAQAVSAMSKTSAGRKQGTVTLKAPSQAMRVGPRTSGSSQHQQSSSREPALEIATPGKATTKTNLSSTKAAHQQIKVEPGTSGVDSSQAQKSTSKEPVPKSATSGSALTKTNFSSTQQTSATSGNAVTKTNFSSTQQTSATSGNAVTKTNFSSTQQTSATSAKIHKKDTKLYDYFARKILCRNNMMKPYEDFYKMNHLKIPHKPNATYMITVLRLLSETRPFHEITRLTVPCQHTMDDASMKKTVYHCFYNPSCLYCILHCLFVDRTFVPEAIRDKLAEAEFHGNKTLIANVENDVLAYLIAVVLKFEESFGEDVIDSIFTLTFEEEVACERGRCIISRNKRKMMGLNFDIQQGEKFSVQKEVGNFFRGKVIYADSEEPSGCGCSRDYVISTSHVTHLPAIFTVRLNRFDNQGDVKSPEDIIIPHNLELKSGGHCVTYTLYAMICHLGPSLADGQFCFKSLCPIEDRLVLYKFQENSTKCQVITNNQPEFRDECAYMLFYEASVKYTVPVSAPKVFCYHFPYLEPLEIHKAIMSYKCTININPMANDEKDAVDEENDEDGDIGASILKRTAEDNCTGEPNIEPVAVKKFKSE